MHFFTLAMNNGLIPTSGFWREDKLRKLAIPLIAQIDFCVRLATSEGRTILVTCLSNLVNAITDESLLMDINSGLLMHTRSEDAGVRIFALRCAETIWIAHGGKLLGLPL